MDDAEIDYLFFRHQQESTAASRAADLSAHKAHLLLAERYSEKAWALLEREASAPILRIA